MPAISETYASPGLRLGLLLEDHPDATYDFALVTGTDVGIPDEYGGAKRFCLATIRFAGSRSDVSAWKPVANSGTSDDWNILCTKTLGRALKRAGYPDDLKDLKALVLWRQRDAEIAAIRSGTQQLELPRANTIAAVPSVDPMQVALDEAAVPDAETVGVDEADDTPPPPVTSEVMNEIGELEAGLTAKDRKVYDGFLKQIGVEPGRFPDAVQAEQILGWFAL